MKTLNPHTLLDISRYMSKSDRKKEVGRRFLQLLIDTELKKRSMRNV